VRLVLHTESSLGLGGQELRTLNEARWLSRRGWRMLLVGPPASRLLARAREAGVDTAAMPMRGAWDLPAVWALAQLVRAREVALVHTHSSVDAWLGGMAARVTGRPVVRTRHVSIPVQRRWNLVYTRLADQIITSGEAIRSLLVAAGVPAARIVAVPAGVNLDEFRWREPGDADGAGVRKELGLDGAAVVGSVAMFRGSKGHVHLLDALAALRAEVPSARLLLVGDGIRRPWVAELARERGLTDAVVFTGFRTDVPALLAAMDCFALASTRTEGVPQSLLQALATGVPVVASDIGGVPEVVRHGETGLLVPPGDAAALAGAMAEVIARDRAAASRRAHAARRLVEAHFSHVVSLDRLVAVYEQVLGNRRGGRRRR
jgi:glycosyltransferase involved in cell wall biosynthesis